MPVGVDTEAYRRNLPHLSKLGKSYFVTFCTRNRRVLADHERDIVLGCCVRDHRLAYWLHCAVVMPDHVHVLFTAYEMFTLPKILHRLKSVSSHHIRRGSVWQREAFDRIVRTDEDLFKKAEYICENPVRGGLVARMDEYRWVWRWWVEGSAAGAAAAPLRT